MMSAARFLSDENYYLQMFANTIAESIRQFNSEGLPKYGHLSMMPCMIRVFDNPGLVPFLGNTAVVINETGEIYIYADFLKENAQEDMDMAEKGQPTANARFVALHELSHQMLSHIHSMAMFTELRIEPDSANRGMDTAIDGMLIQYPDIKLGPRFDSIFDPEEHIITEGFYGTTQEEYNFFRRFSMPEICRHYQDKKDELKQRQQQKKQSGNEQGNSSGTQPNNQAGNQQGNSSGTQPNNQAGNQQGNSSGTQPNNQPGKQQGNSSGTQPNNQPGKQQGNSSGTQPNNQAGNQQGNSSGTQPTNQAGNQQGNSTGEQPKEKSLSDGGSFGLDHQKSLSDVVDALKANGLDHVAKHFGYPEEISQAISDAMVKQQADQMKRIDAQVNEMMAKSKRGDPCASFFAREHKAAQKRNDVSIEGLVSFINTNISGELNYTDAEPGLDVMHDQAFNQEYYGVDAMPYVGIYAPLSEDQTILVVVDTSGSMLHENRLGHALAAIVSIVQGNESITGVNICWADSSVRKISHFNRDEISELTKFEVAGMGGTNMAASLTSSIVMVAQHTDSTKVVILIHDGDDDDLPMQMQDVHETVHKYTGKPMPPLACIIPPGCGASHFRALMEDHALVLEMDNTEGKRLVIDVDVAAGKTYASSPAP
jgi:hypothetical protein